MTDLKALRKRCGVSVKQILAEYSDKRMDMPTFSKIEAGIAGYPPKLVKTILRLCNTTPAELMQDDAEIENNQLASTDKLILSMIGTGKTNAVTYEALMHRTGLPKRQLTNALRRIRKSGVDVCNDQDGVGFYISDDLEDMKRNYIQTQHRGISTLQVNKYRRRILKKAGLI